MKNQTIIYSLRPADHEDIAFMVRLRTKTMKPYFEHTLGWNEAEECEKASDELIHANIVMAGNEKIGVLKVVPYPHELHLHQMQIEPEYQHHGLGSDLIRQTILQSESLGIPITLCVIKTSPAKRLYDRFGFVLTEDHRHYCKMTRSLEHTGERRDKISEKGRRLTISKP